jgi:hypothetical protein
MFLKLTAGGELQFEDRQNFRAFKLVVEGDRARLDAVRRAVAGKGNSPMQRQPGFSKPRCANGQASSTMPLGSRISPP